MDPRIQDRTEQIRELGEPGYQACAAIYPEHLLVEAPEFFSVLPGEGSLAHPAQGGHGIGRALGEGCCG